MGGGVPYGMYASTDAIPRLEDDCSNIVLAQVAGGGQASRTGADDDDVSRGRHGRAHGATLML